VQRQAATLVRPTPSPRPVHRRPHLQSLFVVSMEQLSETPFKSLTELALGTSEWPIRRAPSLPKLRTTHTHTHTPARAHAPSLGDGTMVVRGRFLCRGGERLAERLRCTTKRDQGDYQQSTQNISTQRCHLKRIDRRFGEDNRRIGRVSVGCHCDGILTVVAATRRRSRRRECLWRR